MWINWQYTFLWTEICCTRILMKQGGKWPWLQEQEIVRKLELSFCCPFVCWLAYRSEWARASTDSETVFRAKTLKDFELAAPQTSGTFFSLKLSWCQSTFRKSRHTFSFYLYVLHFSICLETRNIVNQKKSTHSGNRPKMQNYFWFTFCDNFFFVPVAFPGGVWPIAQHMHLRPSCRVVAVVEDPPPP